MLPYSNRVVEHPRRYQLVKVPGTEDIYDFVPVPGQITDAGRAMNKEFFDSIASELVPQGLICMWSGTVVPEGWYLCNGQNGTPDLRNRFIVGSGDEYSIGNTGGEKTHTLSIDEMPSHIHSNKLISSEYGQQGTTPYVKFEYTASNNGKYFNYESQQPKTEATGGGQAHENRPPYYALAFIMKG